MINSVALVALGGALGSVARYLSVSAIGRAFGNALPYGTFAVNVAGSFAIGLLVGLLVRFLPEHQQEMRLFVAVGFLGGFTTFSAFSLDVITLFEEGHAAAALIYVLASVTLSVLALFGGLYLLRLTG